MKYGSYEVLYWVTIKVNGRKRKVLKLSRNRYLTKRHRIIKATGFDRNGVVCCDYK